MLFLAACKRATKERAASAVKFSAMQRGGLRTVWGTLPQARRFHSRAKKTEGVKTMRGFVLWLLGVPFSVIVLLYLFNVL
ncbi:MAG TPA: hypothetical protein PLK13_18095 [Xanthobacteraceae bacterium]|jgi:hypothetical protein|nr:hypothetical protein [Xanthobacteraceae bacterium]